MVNKPFPSTAFRYLTDECIRPYKWVFAVCLILIFMQAGIFSLLDWFLASVVDCIKQGPTIEALHKVLWFVAMLFIADLANVFLLKIAFMFRQKNFYFPVQEHVYKRALLYIFGHSVNYIVNKQTGKK